MSRVRANRGRVNWEVMAILTGDLEGFSARMRRDQEGLVKDLVRFYSRAQALVERRGGRLFRKEGDAIWCSFPSAADCLEAAADLLEDGLHSNRNRVPSDQWRWRFGAHIGKVSLTEEGDILGHTLSVAKRLESACPANAVMVSDILQNKVRGLAGRLEFQAGGNLELKGVGTWKTYVGTLDRGRQADILHRQGLAPAPDPWSPMDTPELYPLKLVQAALGGHASRLIWKLNRNSTEVYFDSPPLAAVRPLKLSQWLDQLPGEEERSAIPGCLRDLFLSLQAAISTRPHELEWASWEGGVGQSIHVFSDGKRLFEKLKKVPHGYPVGCRLRLVTRKERSFFSLMTRSRGPVEANATLHRAALRCRFAPMALSFDGRQMLDPTMEAFTPEDWIEGLALNVPGRFHLVERYLIPRNPYRDLIAGAPPAIRPANHYDLMQDEPVAYQRKAVDFKKCALLYQAARCQLELPPSEELSRKVFPRLDFRGPRDPSEKKVPGCVAMLAIPAALEGSGRLVCIKSGVALRSKRVDLGCPGAVAVIAATGLETLPGRLEVVEDREYHLRLMWLRDQVEIMLAELRKLLGGLDPSLKRHLKERLGWS